MKSNVADEDVLLVLGLHGVIQCSWTCCNVSGYVTIKGSAKREEKISNASNYKDAHVCDHN